MLTQPPIRRRGGAPLVVALVLVVAAAGFLTWSMVTMISAGTDVERAEQDLAAAKERLEGVREDDTNKVKTARGEALEAGQTGVVAMNTLDYRSVDAGLDKWEQVTTGSLHDEVVRGREQSQQTIVNAKSVTKATVLSAAVKAVDDRAGTATVLVALKVNVSTADAEPSDKFMRFECTLLRTEQGWQLDSIGQVPYQQ